MSNLDRLFPGFEAHWIDGPVGKIFARVGGEGPPVVLIHGFPQSHAEWHIIGWPSGRWPRRRRKPGRGT